MQPIIKAGVRILRPTEYEAISGEMPEYARILFNGLLFSGMRYVEAQGLQENSKWFDGSNFINLPKEASLKQKSEFRERTITLNELGE